MYTKAPESDYLDAALITVMQVGPAPGGGGGWLVGRRVGGAQPL